MKYGSLSRRSRRLVKAGIAACAAAAAGAGIFAYQAQASEYNFSSGYSAVNGTFRSVSADWILPTARCTGGSQAISFWVGLSGSNPAEGTNTIAQIGTDANCNGSNPEYYSWWEMYPAGTVGMGTPTEGGDHIHASVVYNGNGQFTLTLKDRTQGWKRTEHETQQPGAGAPTSANVTVEAPADSGGPSGHVTNFGSATFSNIRVNGAPLNRQQLWTGNLVDKSGVQEDTISPLSGDGTRFTATWNSTGDSPNSGG